MASIYVFDFDDTLFKTKNTTTVRHPETEEIESHLSSEELADLEKQHQEAGIPFNKKLTFENFQNVKTPVPIPQTQKIFKNITNKIYSPERKSTSGVYILTARGSDNIPSIQETLSNLGYPEIPILTTDMFAGSNTAEKKKNAIRQLLKTGCDYLEFFDDAISNINLVGELQSEFPNTKIRLRPISYGKNILGASMPRKNVPHRVDEIADSIIEGMKEKKSKLSKERSYDIAYGTAWKQYYKENPRAKDKHKNKKSSEILANLKLAQNLDDFSFFNIADRLDELNSI